MSYYERYVFGAVSAEDREAAKAAGYAAFDAAESLAIVTDRGDAEWVQEAPPDIERARDILRGALVSLVALIGSGRSFAAASIARTLEASPEARALRDAIRRGEEVALGDLLAIYERAAREAEQ
jgi:hypothetical protein